MLMLTENATRAIGALVDRPEFPDSAGVRIAAASDGQAALTVAMAAAPEAHDAIVEDEGARVFVESDAVEALNDKVLDAQIDDDGRVQFTLGTQ